MRYISVNGRMGIKIGVRHPEPELAEVKDLLPLRVGDSPQYCGTGFH
ncbi:hypothetical protein A33Q_2993 [Indibacter alkaliphilus LW1]|uniref:Uncharacterized protein n=1 Tax=Indibacter alkaliphilus (strain CCUG 57479 / KCTC 22604 / LW1) TaxID=1189612 RepID=S2DU90_INDAL|nr:hypothetical protein A33Q_2993 [Indibacter alkaliphilus LW1]